MTHTATAAQSPISLAIIGLKYVSLTYVRLGAHTAPHVLDPSLAVCGRPSQIGVTAHCCRRRARGHRQAHGIRLDSSSLLGLVAGRDHRSICSFVPPANANRQTERPVEAQAPSRP